MHFDMYDITLPVPSDMDPSDLLERLQTFAKELAEEFPGMDDEGDEIELSEDGKDALDNEVSVKPVRHAGRVIS